ncbi:MAG: ATP-binding protein, partial [Cyanobacteria bacterium J06648_11]
MYVREEKLQRRIYQLDEMGNRLDLIAKDSYDPRQRPWYQAAIAARDATWSPIYTFSAFPELGISPSIPLYDETGQLQGVMAVDISLKQLDDFLGALDLGRSGKVFVVEPDGAIVASSVAEPPYRITNEGRERLRAVNSSDPLIHAVANHLVQTYGSFDRAGDNLQFHARSEGKAYFTQLTRIRDGRGLDWITVVAIPRSDLMQPFYRSAYIALLACMGVAIASISFGTWQARRIARPILELSLAAREIASGSQFDRPVSGGSIAEIQGLADAFSRMVQRLQHSLSEAAQLNHTLEVRVRDRTADLERAKQDAEAANAAKSAFLAVMSHELRTPMNAVIGMADVLLLDELAPRHRDSIETIRNSSDTLLAVINDILDVSKIEADRVEIESAPFSLLECVEAAIALVTPQATAKSLDLTYRIAPDAPSEVVGDITRLRQICVNLLGNAVKFTESGSVSLTLSARSLREPEGHRDARAREGDAPSTAILSYPCEIHCEVRDTGIGIAPDRVEQLFEPFAQGDASTTRIYGGTGLGLTICKRLCALMGGHIGVESQLGEGSTFCFTIRARVSPEVAPVTLPNL